MDKILIQADQNDVLATIDMISIPAPADVDTMDDTTYVSSNDIGTDYWVEYSATDANKVAQPVRPVDATLKDLHGVRPLLTILTNSGISANDNIIFKGVVGSFKALSTSKLLANFTVGRSNYANRFAILANWLKTSFGIGYIRTQVSAATKVEFNTEVDSIVSVYVSGVKLTEVASSATPTASQFKFVKGNPNSQTDDEKKDRIEFGEAKTGPVDILYK